MAIRKAASTLDGANLNHPTELEVSTDEGYKPATGYTSYTETAANSAYPDIPNPSNQHDNPLASLISFLRENNDYEATHYVVAPVFSPHNQANISVYYRPTQRRIDLSFL